MNIREQVKNKMKNISNEGTPFIKSLPKFNTFDRVKTILGDGTAMKVTSNNVTVKIDGMFLPHTFEINSVERA